MELFIITFFAILAFIPYVSAHGFVSKVLIDGKEYDGNTPQSSASTSSTPLFLRTHVDTSAVSSPIRMISTIDPVKGADNPSITCGQDAQAAKLTVPANSGSNLQITWESGSGDVDVCTLSLCLSTPRLTRE